MARILSGGATGLGAIRPTRLRPPRRPAAAISVPRVKALFTTARKVKRTRAMANEPMVRIRRSFLRKRLAKMRLLNFTRHLPLRHQVDRIRQEDPFRGGE